MADKVRRYDEACLPVIADGHFGLSGRRYVNPGLSEDILDALFEEWDSTEPTTNCIDYTDEQMEVALAYAEGTLPTGHAACLEEHLLSCARCRYQYVQLKAVCAETTHAVPSPVRELIQTKGPVVFPDASVQDSSWEFGLLSSCEGSRREDLLELFSSRALRLVAAHLRRSSVVLICFGEPMHAVGKRIGSKLVTFGYKDIHVVLADDYFHPKLFCTPDELTHRQVLILTDVVDTGGLLSRLMSLCTKSDPRDLLSLAIIDQSTSGSEASPDFALWCDFTEQRYSRANDRAAADLRFFDPASARAFKESDLPKEMVSPADISRRIRKCIGDLGDLYGHITRVGALKSDQNIAGSRFPWAIDLITLLEDDAARALLLAGAVQQLGDFSRSGRSCLVYPRSRHRRAGALAQLLGDALGWSVIPVGLPVAEHYWSISEAQTRELSKADQIFIVDAAIRTGKTLELFASVLKSCGECATSKLHSFYVFDGMSDDDRRRVEKRVGMSVSSLYRVPLGMPTAPVGPMCRERFQVTLDSLRDREPSHAADILWNYCRKRTMWQARRRPAQRLDSMISLTRAVRNSCVHNGWQLDESRANPRAGLIKGLDANHVLNEPRTRAALHGFLCNSMPQEFIEWCALALSANDDFSWLDHDWLTLHKDLFTQVMSERWQFLVCVADWLRESGQKQAVVKVRECVERFRNQHRSSRPVLFPEFPSEPRELSVLAERCNAVLQMLTAGDT